MNILNLKPVYKRDVVNWFIDNIPEISPYQKEKMKDSDLLLHFHFPYYVYEEKKHNNSNIFVRISIIFLLPTLLLILLSMPFNFIITGELGYRSKRMKWLAKWWAMVGLK